MSRLHNDLCVCFVLPMTGSHPAGLPPQGEILYDLFRAESEGFLATSGKKNRYHRLWDMAAFLIRNRRYIEVQCLSVYSGPSFILADIISRLGKALGQKLILHLHGGGLPDLFSHRPKWVSRVLRRADALVAPSAFLARAANDLGYKCQVIPNVIRLDDYPFRERSVIHPRLFWMRSFHPIWNPEMAVRVVAKLHEQSVPASLVMGGNDKGSLSAVQDLAGKLNVADAVRFAGFLNRESKAGEGNDAGIFLNTNRIDNMPVSVLEACAMGLPVVSTAVGGIPDLLTNEETGLLVPTDDVPAMVAAIVRLLKDPELTLKISRNGRRLAEQSAWPTVREQWRSLFRQLRAYPPA